ncbi:MAG: hypothetical protein ACXWJ4_09075 [Methyloceanibacter sp.]|jgi:hypothetical protein
MTDLKRRARRHGTASIFANGEPRCREFTDHWPKKHKRRHRIPPSKRTMKLRRTYRANRRTALASYGARLAAPWPLYVREEAPD